LYYFSRIYSQTLVTDPDYGIHDLFDAIARKDYPSWTLYIQVMTYEQAAKWEFNPFDITKVSSTKILSQKISFYLSAHFPNFIELKILGSFVEKIYFQFC